MLPLVLAVLLTAACYVVARRLHTLWAPVDGTPTASARRSKQVNPSTRVPPEVAKVQAAPAPPPVEVFPHDPRCADPDLLCSRGVSDIILEDLYRTRRKFAKRQR